MHILYIQQLLVLPDTPGNSRCWEFAQQWKDEGHQISFLTSSSGLPDSLIQEAQQDHLGLVSHQGIDLYVLPIPYSHLMRFHKRMIAFFSFLIRGYHRGKQLKEFDLILAYSAPLTAIELGRRLSRYHQKPLFLELGDVWPDVPIGMGIIRQPWLVRWLHARTKKIYQHAEGIFPYSKGMGVQVASHHVPIEKISVIPNGVNPTKVPIYVRTPTQDYVHVLYTGTIGIANDLTQLIRAIHYIEQLTEVPAIHFTILGEGNDMDRVKQEAHRYNLTSLTFLPKVSREEATRLLQKANIGIISFAAYPVLENNGATKFFDYLASGLPIVINYRGWQATYLEDFQCGLSSDQGDEIGFAENILSLAKDAQLRQKMGMNGRELAETKFSRPKLAKLMLHNIHSRVKQLKDARPSE